jgi:GNAT superfamily N-acetyltransferase
VLQDIDVATGQMFRDIGMPEVGDYDPWPLPELEKSRAAGLLWVVPGEAGGPVAFLMGTMVDGCLHVEQLSTDPASARRGLGRSLLEYAARRAAADGLPALTLTTFAHVPWNAPYYARCGFRILDDAEVTPGLRAIRQREAEVGLDRWPRVCMRRDVPGVAGVPGRELSPAGELPLSASHPGRGHPWVPAACLTADTRAGGESQPACDQTILPDALTRANQGWSWTW